MIDEDIISRFDNGSETPNGIELHSNGNDREASPSPSLINGISKLGIKRTVSFSTDTEEESETLIPKPAMKKRRESVGTDGGLNYFDLLSRKVNVTIIIKSQIRLPVENILTRISELTKGLNRRDKSAIYQKALDVARGLSGSKLISMLEKETTKI